MRVRVLALATYPVEGASSRFRIVQFIEPLAARGIDVTFAPFLDASLFAALYAPTKLRARLPGIALRTLGRAADAFRSADVVLIQREAMLFGPPVIEWVAARLLRRPLLLDLDDATYIPVPSPVYGRMATLLKWPGKTNRLIRWAHTVICGNPNIADYARARGAETKVIPTVVDTHVFRPRTSPSSVSSSIPTIEPTIAPTIGWIGTHTTFPFLERLLPLFERLGRARRFRLRIIGSGREDVRVEGIEVETRAWDLDREAEDFRALDIGVYPLEDDAWNAGKSGLKAVQYMASGVPFVMSPVGVCAAMGRVGETHLAAVTDDEWLDALQRLLDDEELRQSVGQAGRAFAERSYSIDGATDALAAIIQAAVS